MASGDLEAAAPIMPFSLEDAPQLAAGFFIPALLAVLALWVADGIYERLPRVEDEFGYLWQAEVMDDGNLFLVSPSEPSSYLIPFVVDYHGRC